MAASGGQQYRSLGQLIDCQRFFRPCRSTARVKQAMAKLVDRAVSSGDIYLDLDPLDLLRALAGVANIGLGPDGERAAKRLVDILIAGVRTRT
jgi:hypothetical protein